MDWRVTVQSGIVHTACFEKASYSFYIFNSSAQAYVATIFGIGLFGGKALRQFSFP